MDTRNELDLQNQLHGSQPNKRLNEYRSSLIREGNDVVFDDRLLSVMQEYCRKPDELEAIRGYLNHLRDSNGHPFCRSHKDYDQMVSTLENFLKEDVPDGRWRMAFRTSLERVTKRYGGARLKALRFKSDDDIWELIKGLRTSTGYTKLLTGIQHKCDLPFDQLLTTFEEKSGEAISNGSFNSYILWYWRTQASGEFTEVGEMTGEFTSKTRPVWAVDVWTVIAEMMFSKPLTKWLKWYGYSAIGKDDLSIWQETSYRRAHYTRWLSLDYSKFDSSIPAWLIHAAFDVLASAFEELSPEEKALLEAIKNDFIHKNVITGDGVVHVDHGNPSGSGLTAIINGICNELMTETWMVKYGIEGKYMIMGDDNLIFLNKDMDIAVVSSYIMYNFGVKINPDKSKSGTNKDDPEFLSRFWTSNGPYRHYSILVSKMLFPERFRDYDRNPDLDPRMVFYSYILGYRAGMVEFFDVDRFLRENDMKDRRIKSDSVAFKSLPYNVQLAWAA